MAVNQNIQVSTQRQKKLQSWFWCQCLGTSSQDCRRLSRGRPGAVPCQTHSAPAGSDGPTAVHGWASQPGWQCLHEDIFKGRKDCRERGEENKRSEKLHREHQGEREGREVRWKSTPWWSRYPHCSSWSRKIFLRELSLWRWPRVEQALSVRRKEQKRGAAPVLLGLGRLRSDV